MARAIGAARTNRLGRFVLRGVIKSPHLLETCPVRHLLPLLVAVPLCAQRVPPVQYEISVPAAATRLFHVRAEFPARGKDTLYLSLPAWSPGNYEIQNYARYVRHFGAKTPTGQALFWDRFDKDTWASSRRSRSEEHTSELQSRFDLVCRLLLEKKKKKKRHKE